MTETLSQLRRIAQNPTLSFKQKEHALAVEADLQRLKSLLGTATG